MKTISMPLEEYEKEQAQAKNAIEMRSYNKGALEAMAMIRHLVIERDPYAHYIENPELTKAMNKLVEDLERDRIQSSIRYGKE